LFGLFGNVDVCCDVVLVLISAEQSACVLQPRRPQQTGLSAGQTNCGLTAPVVALTLQPPQLFGSAKVFVSQPVEEPGARQDS